MTASKLNTSVDLQSAGASLFSVLNLLEALVNSDRGGDDDGRLIVTPQSTSITSCSSLHSPASIRFVILNPGRYLHGIAKIFSEISLISDAR